MRKLEVQFTDDGSATFYVCELDEHYHSVKGALSEAEHIYRDSAFLFRLSIGNTTMPLTILEIGFGTGLNAVVTAMAADTDCPVHYITLEKYPLASNVLSQLGYARIVDADLFDAVHAAVWNEAVTLTPSFTIEKRQCDALEIMFPSGIDVVYFDAFAPEKQPEMWNKRLFERIYAAMNPCGVLTTYCAKGIVRRMLQDIGFVVERLPGPKGGKREILRALKL